MKISAPCAAVCVQSASLPGRRSFRVALCRSISFSCGDAGALRPLDRPVEQLARLVRRCRQPVVEGILERVVDDAGRSGEESLSFVWPTNSGSRTNTESIAEQKFSTSSR